MQDISIIPFHRINSNYQRSTRNIFRIKSTKYGQEIAKLYEMKFIKEIRQNFNRKKQTKIIFMFQQHNTVCTIHADILIKSPTIGLLTKKGCSLENNVL